MLTSTRNQLLTQAMVDEVPHLEDHNRRLAEVMEDRRSECQRDALSRSWVYGDSLHRTDLGVDQSLAFLHNDI